MKGMRAYSRSLLKKIPILDTHLQKRRLQHRFQVELDLARGREHPVHPHASILHFSVNKAATQYTKNLLKRCAARNGLIPVGLHEYAFHLNFPYLDQLSLEEMRSYQHVFRQTGYLYSVFGGMIEGIPEFERYRTVLMVRDPRDVLVSNYYSVGYSHPEPDAPSGKRDEFLRLRKEAQSLSIDEFVLAESERMEGTLERYRRLLLDRYPDTHLTRYEEMVGDFEGWLDRLLGYCDLVISGELRESLIEENRRSRPASENVHRHVRKGVPGDFREKLQPATIRELDVRFGSLLDAFGYADMTSAIPAAASSAD